MGAIQKKKEGSLPDLEEQPFATNAGFFHRHWRALVLPIILLAGVLLQLQASSVATYEATSASAALDALHYSKICPNLSFIGLDEFTARRTQLAKLLQADQEYSIYVSEPSPNSLYYLNISTSSWYLSERPWIVAISPTKVGSHLTVLTPAFELSRSQRLPFALTPSERESVSWVVWQEADDPYGVLLNHVEGLRKAEGFLGPWSVHLEENVREFVSSGLEASADQLEGEKPKVTLASLQVREQRMRKTSAELALQRCAAKVTIEALRAVRRKLWIGMTEKEGEKLIVDALTAGGLVELDKIVLFGENAALPHASGGDTRKLAEGEFALFDVGGNLGGYQSDFTRTMLPDPPSSRFDWRRCHHRSTPAPGWPNARAKKIWETVHEAQEAALKALERDDADNTVFAADVDKAARNVITEAGWGPYFTHRLGHGIGLQVHEHPYLNSGNRQPLQTGETFSNEPGIYIEKAVDTNGSGIGVRLEDMVVKTQTGWELISGEPLARSPWSP